VLEKYGADLGLDAAQQQRQMELQIPLVRPEEGGQLFLFDPALIDVDMRPIAEASGRTVPPTDELVDLTPLQDALASL
jgi:hypothetical protein